MPKIDYFKRNKKVSRVTNIQGKHADPFHKYSEYSTENVEDIKGVPEGVSQRRTDNTVAKRKKTERTNKDPGYSLVYILLKMIINCPSILMNQ